MHFFSGSRWYSALCSREKLHRYAVSSTEGETQDPKILHYLIKSAKDTFSCVGTITRGIRDQGGAEALIGGGGANLETLSFVS